MKEQTAYHYHYCQFCHTLVSQEEIPGMSSVHAYDSVCDQCKTGRVNRDEHKNQSKED